MEFINNYSKDILTKLTEYYSFDIKSKLVLNNGIYIRDIDEKNNNIDMKDIDITQDVHNNKWTNNINTLIGEYINNLPPLLQFLMIDSLIYYLQPSKDFSRNEFITITEQKSVFHTNSYLKNMMSKILSENIDAPYQIQIDIQLVHVKVSDIIKNDNYCLFFDPNKYDILIDVPTAICIYDEDIKKYICVIGKSFLYQRLNKYYDADLNIYYDDDLSTINIYIIKEIFGMTIKDHDDNHMSIELYLLEKKLRSKIESLIDENNKLRIPMSGGSFYKKKYKKYKQKYIQYNIL